MGLGLAFALTLQHVLYRTVSRVQASTRPPQYTCYLMTHDRAFMTLYHNIVLLKKNLHQLTVVDQTLLNQDEEMVKKKTLLLRAQINSKDLGRTVFNLVSILHKAILGIPCLEKTNPTID